MRSSAGVVSPFVKIQNPGEEETTQEVVAEEQPTEVKENFDPNKVIVKDGKYYFADGRPASRQVRRRIERMNKKGLTK